MGGLISTLRARSCLACSAHNVMFSHARKTLFSQRHRRPSCCREAARRKGGRREAGCLAATHGPVREEMHGTGTTGTAAQPAFPAQWFTVSFVLSQGIGFLAPVARAMQTHCRDLGISTEMSGPYNFAVRAISRTSVGHGASTASRLSVRDDAYAPLEECGTGGTLLPICPTRQRLSPATDWHDGQFAHGSRDERSGHQTGFDCQDEDGKRDARPHGIQMLRAAATGAVSAATHLSTGQSTYFLFDFHCRYRRIKLVRLPGFVSESI
jgi:hypothetical protein